MRILQVMAGGKHGGAETAFVDMCIALHEAGESVEVVTRANDVRVPPLEEAGLVVHKLPFGGRMEVYTKWRMRQIICKFKPDIVQSWMSRAPWKVPAWSEGMKIPRYLNVARLGNYYKLKYFHSMDYFVTITLDIKTYLVDNGIAADNVQQINNFAETESVVTPISRAEFDTPEAAPLLLGLGRLHPAKAFDTLIKAVAELDGVHLWIAGEGPQRAELEALIFSLKLDDRVKLLGWRSDRAALFQAVDICVFSSRFEPFGTVFVQAWAQQTPLITTTADGPRQFVRHEEDGLVVEIDDVAAMREEIAHLIADEDLRNKLVENGLKRYEGEFTKEQCVRSYLDFYHAMRAKEQL